jgi:hypothetical protein
MTKGDGSMPATAGVPHDGPGHALPDSSRGHPLPAMNWGGMSRRSFLKSLCIAAGAAGAGLALEGCAPGAGKDDSGRRFLFFDDDEAMLMQKLGEAVIPAQHGFPSLAETGVLRRADEELSLIGASIQHDMHAALGILLWAPLAYGHWSRYTKLGLDDRRAVLKRMMNSRSEILRAVGVNLKVLVHFFYFGHPATWAAIGYDGPFSRLPPIMSEQRQWYAQQTGAAAGDPG